MPAPTVIGVDDWAMKKRLRYGTIVVDLERHRPIDLLPDRTSETVNDWLGSRNGIEIVARDRSTEYRRGITTGAPNAVQVADRWHLFHNTRQMVERWTASAHSRLRRLPSLQNAETSGKGRTKAFPRTRSDTTNTIENRERRKVQYEDIRRRYLAGEKLKALSRSTGLARATVRKFALAENFPERSARSPEKSIIDPYLPMLEAQLAQGCENGSQLWREVRDAGFPGTPKQIRRWLQDRRTGLSKFTPHRNADHDRGSEAPHPLALPSPKQLAWIIVKAPDTRSAEESDVIQRIGQDRDACVLSRLIRQFVDLVRRVGTKARDAGPAFDEWLLEAKGCGVRPFETFAAGLEQDSSAVHAALQTRWSNAQTEGQVTKLKLLKRSMYGRGNLDLLRRRLLLAA